LIPSATTTTSWLTFDHRWFGGRRATMMGSKAKAYVGLVEDEEVGGVQLKPSSPAATMADDGKRLKRISAYAVVTALMVSLVLFFCVKAYRLRSSGDYTSSSSSSSPSPSPITPLPPSLQLYPQCDDCFRSLPDECGQLPVSYYPLSKRIPATVRNNRWQYNGNPG